MNGRAYKAMLYLGCVLGVYAGTGVADGKGLDSSRFALVTIALLVPAFAGARAWFVLRHLGLYRHDLRRVAARKDGGAALFGGLLVGVVVSVPVLHLVRLPFWTFWDAASVTMLVGLIVTRVGCLLNGCCAGRPTESWLGMVLPNVVGTRTCRYPTQILEAGYAALVLLAALALRTTLEDGVVFVLVVGLYCSIRVLLQGLREPVTSHLQPEVAGADVRREHGARILVR